MVINKTGITDISTFDSTLPNDVVQKLNVSKNYEKPNKNITFIEKLLERDVISDTEHKKVALMLEINGDIEDNPHSFIDYSVPLATASYTYDPVNKVCYVGMVSVQDELRKRGIGTQMKKHLNNYMSQENRNVIAYTWLSTEEGKKLAKKTQFSPDNDKFYDINQIWSRKF